MAIGNWLKWGTALAVSVGVHLAAARLLEPPPPLVQIAGGQALEVSMLGDAFEETLQSGDPTEAIDPSADPVSETQPLDAETIETTQTIPPVETIETPTDSIAPILPETLTETAMADQTMPPVEADVLVPADEPPPLSAENPEVIAAIAPVQTVVPVEKPDEIKPVEPEKDIQPETEKVEKPVKKAVEKPKPVRRKVVRKTAGEGGVAAVSQKKGVNDGSAAGSAGAKGDKGTVSRQAGNAAVSNYRGKVQSRVNRAFRSSAARHRGIKGSGQARFTVSANGSVSGVSISRSSGSPVLDQAALEAVRRAAPYPKIPANAGRDRWDFSIPFTFN